jgi:microcystin-dependent protein
MKEASATRLTSAYFGGDSTALGATGGAESQTLTLAQLPTGITSGNTSQLISVTSTVGNIIQGGVNSAGNGSFTSSITLNAGSGQGPITATGNNSINVTSSNTSGNAHRTVQPTIVCGYIIRII